MHFLHEFFGELKRYHYYWEKDIYVRFINRDRKVILSLELNHNTENYEMLTYKNFLKNEEEILKKVEKAIFNYYQGVCLDYRKRSLKNQSKINNFAPIIKNSSELDDLLQFTYIVIPTSDLSKEVIGLLFECSWEEEHGLGVRIENGEVVEVGFQNVII